MTEFREIRRFVICKTLESEMRCFQMATWSEYEKWVRTPVGDRDGFVWIATSWTSPKKDTGVVTTSVVVALYVLLIGLTLFFSQNLDFSRYGWPELVLSVMHLGLTFLVVWGFAIIFFVDSKSNKLLIVASATALWISVLIVAAILKFTQA